jgi:2-phospho-L-lactate/phosphoenolpyruvate guanylyltransferase
VTGALAVVPLRDGRSGKTRLAHVLTPAERSALVVALARHVVGTLAGSDGLTQVLVVSADQAFASAAVGDVPGRVRVVAQPADRPGLNGAVDVGREAAVRAGVRLLAVHADLPALAADDVAALLSAPGAVTLAPDRLGTGTNALVLDRPAAPFGFRFGPGSLAAHRAQADAHGLTAAEVLRPGTAVDLDTPADWAAVPAAVRHRLVAEVPGLARLGDGLRLGA